MARKKQQPLIDLDTLTQKIDAVVEVATQSAGDRLRESSPAWLGRLSDGKWEAGPLLAYVRLKENDSETTAAYPGDAPVQLFEANLPVRVKLVEGKLEIVGLNAGEGVQFFEGQLPANAVVNLPLAMTQSNDAFRNAAVTTPTRLMSPIPQQQYSQIVAVNAVSGGSLVSGDGEGSRSIDGGTLQIGDCIEVEIIGSYQSSVGGNSVAFNVSFTGSLGTFGLSLTNIPTSTVSQTFRLTARGYIVNASNGKFLIEGVFPPASPVVQLSNITTFGMYLPGDLSVDVTVTFTIAGTNRVTADILAMRVVR